jgi:Protein of unknown function (DUF2934)
MARTRKTESDIVVSAATAAPARRKPATAARKPLAAATKAPVALAEAAPAAAIESVVVQYTPTNEEIAVLAYSYWVTRGYQDGCPEEDWLRAEQELLRLA